MKNFLILPHQLFDKKYFKEDYNFIIWEHPQYFKKYKFNKKKLILHRASMRFYFDYLKKNKYQVKYYEFKEKPKELSKGYTMFDPIDKIKLTGKKEILESPNFLLSKEYYEKYRKKTKTFFFNSFYMKAKVELDIIPKVKSRDKYNRDKMPKDTKIPKLPSNKSDKKYINEAIKYVEKNFPNNYGNTENFEFPVTFKTANKWLNEFIKKKFKNFGPYQDAIVKDENYLFHSCLSSSINIGLINPTEIINKISKIKSKININSYEGYIRQLFWREYQRYTYIYANFNVNYFGNKKRLNKKWYTGELGIDPVDNAIKMGFDTGYLHHINRLMIVGNFMNISQISPKQGFKWFMEFSIDSYEWVMHQNVLDMVFCVTGGKTMRKPYISSSNYVLKMSNFKKGDWSEEWNELYRKFLKKNKSKLWKFRYNFPSLKKM